VIAPQKGGRAYCLTGKKGIDLPVLQAARKAQTTQRQAATEVKLSRKLLLPHLLCDELPYEGKQRSGPAARETWYERNWECRQTQEDYVHVFRRVVRRSTNSRFTA